jgi:signal transduction histidine kinase
VLINDLLDLSRLESGHVELVVESFSVEALLLEIGDALKPLFAAKGNRWGVEIDAGVGQVTSDRGRLRQILVNLLANANKFTDEGRITARVRQQDGELVIEVIDTGIGMPEELLPRIFDAFERLPGMERRQGTGLGLAIVAVLSEALGASITVQNEVGKGSRFTLRLPVGAEEAI